MSTRKTAQKTNSGVRKRRDTIVGAVKGSACAMNWQVIAEARSSAARVADPTMVLVNRLASIYKNLDVAVQCQGGKGRVAQTRRENLLDSQLPAEPGTITWVTIRRNCAQQQDEAAPTPCFSESPFLVSGRPTERLDGPLKQRQCCQ